MCATMSKCCGRYGLGKSLVTLTRSGWRASTVLKLMSVSTYLLPSFSVCFRMLSIAFSLMNFVVLSLESIVCVVYYAYLFLIVGKGFWFGVDGVSSLRRMMRWFQIILNCNLLGSCLLWRFFFVLYSIPLWSWQCERVFDVDGFSSLRITLRWS